MRGHHPTGFLLVAAISTAVGFLWWWGIVVAGPARCTTTCEYWLVYYPAPLWGAAVALAVFWRGSGILRTLLLGVVGAATGFGGGFLGLLLWIAIHGTGT